MSAEPKKTSEEAKPMEGVTEGDKVPPTATATAGLSADAPNPPHQYDDMDIPSDIPGLSLFDVHREPRTLITDNRKKTIPINKLHSEFTCPVCFDIIKETMTVKECLHRFCAECISRSLRLGKRECPSCRVKCASKRELRRDRRFDWLIARAFPDLRGFEEEQDALVQKVVEEGEYKERMKEMEAGKLRQAAARKLPRPAVPKKRKLDASGKSTAGAGSSGMTTTTTTTTTTTANTKGKGKRAASTGRATASDTDPLCHLGSATSTKNQIPPSTAGSQTITTSTGRHLHSTTVATIRRPKSPVILSPNQEVAFFLLRHPEETRCPELGKQRLRTSVCLRARHLCKYLSLKLGDIPPGRFQLAVFNSQQYTVPISKDIELGDVYMTHWARSQEFYLYYYLRPSKGVRPADKAAPAKASAKT